jgi:hypothetical protein
VAFEDGKIILSKNSWDFTLFTNSKRALKSSDLGRWISDPLDGFKQN